MKNLQVVLLTFAAAVIVVSLAAQRAQAVVPNPSLTTSIVYLPLLAKNYQPPPPVYPPINKITYASGYTSANQTYNIYVMNPDGTGQTQITNQSGSRYLKPTWSPDGTKIAFFTITTINNDTANQIWVMNANGSGAFNLVAVPGHHFQPTWSPYGNRIAFSSDLFNPGASTPNDIYVVNADGSGSLLNLTNSPTAHDAWPDWSPDGRHIAYGSAGTTSNSQIYVMNADGSGQMNVSNSAYIDWGPNWSPDSQKIAFYRNLGSSSSPNNQIFVMNADGSGQTQLTSNAGQNSSPNWSPDGTRFAFQTYYSNYADIYIMNADGTGVTNITNHQLSYASIQPDWR